MSRLFQNTKLRMVLLTILVVIGFGIAYLTIFQPKLQEKAMINMRITNLKNETLASQKQIDNLQINEEEIESNEDIRKRLPSERAIDELLRTLNKFERASNARIDTISFTQYDQNLNEAGISTEDEGSIIENLLSNISIQKDSEQVPLTETENLPDNLKFITFQVDVEVKSYLHLLKFLTAIEKEERFIRVDEVSFTQLKQTDPEEPIAPIMLHLQLTTYYFKDEVN